MRSRNGDIVGGRFRAPATVKARPLVLGRPQTPLVFESGLWHGSRREVRNASTERSSLWTTPGCSEHHAATKCRGYGRWLGPSDRPACLPGARLPESSLTSCAGRFHTKICASVTSRLPGPTVCTHLLSCASRSLLEGCVCMGGWSTS